MTGGGRGGGGLHTLPEMTADSSRERNRFKAGLWCCDWPLEFVADSVWFNRKVNASNSWFHLEREQWLSVRSSWKNLRWAIFTNSYVICTFISHKKWLLFQLCLCQHALINLLFTQMNCKTSHETIYFLLSILILVKFIKNCTNYKKSHRMLCMIT